MKLKCIHLEFEEVGGRSDNFIEIPIDAETSKEIKEWFKDKPKKNP